MDATTRQGARATERRRACQPPPAPAPETDAPPSLRAALTGRRALLMVAVLVLAAVSVALLLPALADLPQMWSRVIAGDPSWLALALGFEALSFLGHIVLFRAVALDGRQSRIGMRESTLITLAGHAATRLFASAGAGGVALTAWALRRSGMERHEVGTRMTTFLVLLYSVYMAALIVGGLGLFLGILPGDAPLAMTLAPAAFGAVVIALALLLPRAHGLLARRGSRLAPVSASVGEGVRNAGRMARGGHLGLLGALLWWGFDIAVLWACFNAFGVAPEPAVIVVAYFVGMLANTLPLPGGLGGVDGGMIGALIAFGVDPGLSVLAVLAYRGFAFWLPIAPGVLAYVGLRRTVAGWDAPRRAGAGAGAHSAPARNRLTISRRRRRRGGRRRRSARPRWRPTPRRSGGPSPRCGSCRGAARRARRRARSACGS